MIVIECNDVTKTYGNHHVLDKVNFTIKEGVLTGIIGRNGVGKTTLMKMIAGFLRESSGTIQVFGEQPFNNLKVSTNTIFIDDAMHFPDSMTLQDILHECQRFYPNWDAELASRLIGYFVFHLGASTVFYRKGKRVHSTPLLDLPHIVHSPFLTSQRLAWMLRLEKIFTVHY